MRFEDLDVWKESMRLVVDIYAAIRASRDFGLRDQIQRSAVSIPSNIAEGYDRQTNQEFIQFLYIAKGSCGELRTQLYIAAKTESIEQTMATDLIDRTKKISAMLTGLIKTRKERF